MSSRAALFLIAGIASGLAVLVVGMVWRTSLALSGGFFFAVTLFLALCANKQFSEVRRHGLRYSIALTACIPAYVLVVFTLASASQFLAHTLNVVPSADIQNPRIDLMFGLLASFWVAAFLSECLAYVLTSSWSFRSLGESFLVGTSAVVLSLLVNAPFHQYWLIVGTLLISGQAMFLWQVGRRLENNYQLRPI